MQIRGLTADLLNKNVWGPGGWHLGFRKAPRGFVCSLRSTGREDRYCWAVERADLESKIICRDMTLLHCPQWNKWNRASYGTGF